MKLLPIQQQNKPNSTPQFNGVVDSTLRYLATNQAIGANSVDVCFMVTPRSANDTIKRGPAAGWETFRREIMGTINDSCIGFFGTIAGVAIALGINKKYGFNINKMFTAPETLNILAENKAHQVKNNKKQIDYLKETLSYLRAYNPTLPGSDKEGYVKLSEKTINDVAKMLDTALNKNDKEKIEKWLTTNPKNVRSVAINKIIADTGAQSNFILESADKKIISHTNLKSFLNDIFIVSDSFNKEKVKEAFNEQIKHNKKTNENVFIKNATRFMKTRAGMGFAMASAVGLSVQPINMYLTKKKTGQDGFVGVAGRTKDKSAGFFGIKTLSSIGFMSMILATLNLKPWKATPKKFMEKMAFNGKMPTINQLKGIYGITIISRIFSARDKDELREVLTKDTLGYLSWLVLGDIVNRITAQQLDEKVLNFKKGTEGKNYFKKMFYASLKTRDEVLLKTLKDNGVDVTKKEGGKEIALTFKEMLKELNTNSNISEAIRKNTRRHLTILNRAQLAGYLFSGLVLGLGIPNLNIYITNKLDKKRKEEAARLAAQENKEAV